MHSIKFNLSSDDILTFEVKQVNLTNCSDANLQEIDDILRNGYLYVHNNFNPISTQIIYQFISIFGRTTLNI